MSSFEELQKRVVSAEKQFAALSRQRRDYGQRLIDMISMHERNLADSDGRAAALRAEAEEAKALAAQRERELGKVQGENEQLRQMLHALLTAIERGRSNEFEETMLELDQRISAMVAASGDAGPPSAEEVSQAPEIWSHPAQDDDEEEILLGQGRQGLPDIAEKGRGNPYVTADRERQVAEQEPAQHAKAAGPGMSSDDELPEGALAEGDLLEGDLAEGDTAGWGGSGRDADRPPTLEEVLEFAEASAQVDTVEADGFLDEDGDRLSESDMASLTRMLEQSLAAGEDEGADGAHALADDQPASRASGLMQAPISEIADRIRAEQESGGPASDPGGAGLLGEEEEEGFELLDEAELEKSLGQMSDRLFAEDDYDEAGFGPAEARRDDDDDDDDDAAAGEEADEETAFDLSDLDLGGEIDDPPEAESGTVPAGGPEEAGHYALDDGDGDTADGGETQAAALRDDAETEEEAELARWQAEVLGRVAAETGAGPRAGQPAQREKPPAAQAGRGGEAHGPGAGSENDDALAELDAILAEEDRAFDTDSDVAPADPDAEWDRPAGGATGGPARRGLAPAVRDSLDAATRAEILARVRQSHTGSRSDQDD